MLSLNTEAEKAGLSVDDEIKLDSQRMRRQLADRVVQVFVQANIATLTALGALVGLDELKLWLRLIAPGDRIISNQVIMSLLAATIVQVGVISVIIARHLFPRKS